MSLTIRRTVVTLANGPVLSITSVAGVAAPSSPGGSLGSPDVVLPATITNPVAVALAAANIPAGTNVTVTVAGQTGGTTSTVTTLSGTTASSTASANVTIPTTQPSVISATATFPLSSQSPGGPTFVQGEEVEWVRVTARVGGRSHVAYVTKSGRIVEASAIP
jgi:hypothetical protein